jgi:periplasmic protein TonB
MDRQLFSQTSRVSTRRNGAVPVSVALHVIAIGSAVFASAAMMPALPAVEPPPPNIPVVFVPQAVRVEPPPPPPPKGQPKAGPPRKAAGPPPPAVPVAVAPLPNLENVADIEDIVDSETPVSLTGSGASNTPPCVGCAEGPGTPDGVVGGTGPIRVHTGIDAPARIHFVEPRYPPVAITARVQGRVTVDCVIGPDGKVYEARVLEGNVLLQRAALDAVRQWRYTRPRLNDTPISVLLTVTVDFQLR